MRNHWLQTLSARGPRLMRGFTLIELAVVLGIVAILSGLTATALRRTFAQGRMNENMRALTSELQAARLRAITTGIPYGVYIGGPTSSLQPSRVVLFSKPLGAAVSPAVYDPTANDLLVDFRGVQAAASTNLNAPGSYVTFSQGVPTAGDTTVVFDSFGIPNVSSAATYTTTPTAVAFVGTNPYVFEIQSIAFPTEHRQVQLKSNGAVRTVSP